MESCKIKRWRKDNAQKCEPGGSNAAEYVIHERRVHAQQEVVRHSYTLRTASDTRGPRGGGRQGTKNIGQRRPMLGLLAVHCACPCREADSPK